MIDDAITGHDGPYDAPVTVEGGRVEPAWIDYNGHMNVAYYTLAFDAAIDVFLEDHLGLGLTFVRANGCGPYALQSSYTYLAEMLEGEAYTTTVKLLDHDAKRMHLFCRIYKLGGTLAASVETLIMNVDHRAKRGAPYPDWAQARLARMHEAHRSLKMPEEVGSRIGIRRR